MTGYGARQNAPRVGLSSIIIKPILIIVLVLGFLIFNLVGTIGVLTRGGELVYVEETFTTHSNNISKKAVEGVEATDDVIIIMFLYNEDTQKIEHIVKAGGNISDRVVSLFSSNDGFSKLIENINKNNFENTMKTAMEKIAEEIDKLNLFSVYETKNNVGKSHAETGILVNEDTALKLSESETLESALASFTEKTEIPVVISVDTYEGVFGRTMPWTDILFEVLLLAVAVYLIFGLVKKIRAFKKMEADFATQPQDPQPVRSPYYDDEEDEEESDEEGEYEDEEEIDEAMEEVDEAAEEVDEAAEEVDEAMEEDDEAIEK